MHRSRQPHLRSHHRRGAFTFLEILVVLVILGITSAAALPKLGGSMQRQRLLLVANTFVDDINRAREFAFAASRRIEISMNMVGGHGYSMTGLPDLDNPGQDVSRQFDDLAPGIAWDRHEVDTNGSAWAYDLYGKPKQIGSDTRITSFDIVLKSGSLRQQILIDLFTGVASLGTLTGT